MHSLISLESMKEHSYFTVTNDIIDKVSQSFAGMTEYLIEDFLGKGIEDVFKILRIGPNIEIADLDENTEHFLFTKSLEVKFVKIGLLKIEQKEVYVFIEKPNSSIYSKFPFACKLASDNHYGIGIFSLPDITLLKANDTYAGFFDAPYNKKENCIGRRVSEFVTGFKGSTSEKLWQDIIATGEPYNSDEYVYDRFERGVTYYNSTITPIYEDGKPKYCIEMTIEITEQVLHRKKIEEQAKVIEQQKKELEAIIDNMSDTLMVFDKDGSYILKSKDPLKTIYSDSYKNIGDSYKPGIYFDLEGNELPYSKIPSVRVLNGEKISEQIMSIKFPEGERFVGVSGTPLFDEDGCFHLGILCVREITEAVRLDRSIKYHQEAALKAEKEKREALEKAIEMKDEFLSIISHEFRTPLNVINTAVQAMNYICGDELSDRSKRYLNIIRQNTFRQLRLVNNLLDITRADAGRIKIHKRNIDIVFMTKSIVESVSTYASQKGVTVAFTATFEKKILGIDDEKYERILLNLLSNAIKFTPKGKNINVKLRTIDGNVCIEVKDNGIGIPKDKVEMIFERFGQVDSSLSRQAEGAGIGLSLVKKLVEALGGSISVKSKEGKGSNFIIMLPNETVAEEPKKDQMEDLLDNRLVQVTTVEFSDIYL